MYVDISAPTFKLCPKDIETLTDKGSRSAIVNWTAPRATDNSPHKPTIIQHGKKPGDKFDEGHHTITYTATDKSGNIAHCLFQVVVKGTYDIS